MSMPSSSELVATRHGSAPALSASSISTRASRAHRAVVCARDRLACQLVEAQGQPLGEPAAVHEHERRAVRAHELEQLRVDRRPDRAGRRVGRSDVLGRHRRGREPEVCEVLDRDPHLELELLAHSRVDDRDGPLAADEARDRFERTLGGRERDPLRVASGQVREALEREREVGATLGRRHRVDLVHDDGLDIAQQLARAGGQQQEQALGRRDQDVGRRAQHARGARRPGCRRCAPRR